MIPYTSYLRVYEPLDAFAGPSRERLAALVQGAPDRAASLAAEESAIRGVLLASPPVPSERTDAAYVLVRDDTPFLCPLQLQVRPWQALAEFRTGFPEAVADAFVPRGAAEAAAESLEKWYVDEAEPRVHIRTATWHVPVHWFAAFDSDERDLYLGGEDEPGVRRCLFRTRMAPARRRIARALAVVRRSFGTGDATAELEELGRWLEEFHPHAWVELDYGGLVELLSDASLRDDHSAELLAGSVAALSEGDADTAMSVFATVVNWWRRVQGLEHAN